MADGTTIPTRVPRFLEWIAYASLVIIVISSAFLKLGDLEGGNPPKDAVALNEITVSFETDFGYHISHVDVSCIIDGKSDFDDLESNFCASSPSRNCSPDTNQVKLSPTCKAIRAVINGIKVDRPFPINTDSTSEPPSNKHITFSLSRSDLKLK